MLFNLVVIPSFTETKDTVKLPEAKKNLHNVPSEMNALPEGETGIAHRYPGDVGIERDPEVLFVEDFTGSIDAVFQRWEDVNNRELMSLSEEVPPGSAGKNSMLFTHRGAGGQTSSGAGLYRRLLPGYDQLYVRMYVKFNPDCYPLHHFGASMGGYNPPTRWPQGHAGERPSGDDRFSTNVEPFGKEWRWDFYTYWTGMRTNPDTRFWGNDFINDPDLKVERGRWVCLEFMIKMNDPVTDSNGELALWIDGRLRKKDGQVISHLGKGFPNGKWVWDSWIPNPEGAPFKGFQWRKGNELDLNYIWLYVYYTGVPEDYISKVWFDNVVVAKNYIGPMTRRAAQLPR